TQPRRRGATFWCAIRGVILPHGRDLNRELARTGFAWWYWRYAPDDETLAQLEREARGAKRGLWADPHAVPPWEWPKTHRAISLGTVYGAAHSHDSAW
ncbi:MAG: thermonuclease family protein, partial [Nitrospirae bacterium]|nr:thermonuclease family protein [Nitrospirota bacterium]